MPCTLLSTTEVKDTKIAYGSDHHFSLTDDPKHIANRFIAELSELQTDIVIFPGDFAKCEHGQNASSFISSLIRSIARKVAHIVFTPGNHDLCGRSDPWSTFDLPANVIYPTEPLMPVEAIVGNVRILAANLFYDGNFIDPNIIDMTPTDVDTFYHKHMKDGTHFLGGDRSLFPQMTEQLINHIHPGIDVVVTHSLPTPRLVTFRSANSIPEGTEILPGVPFVYNPKEDEKYAQQKDTTPEAFRRWWNMKSILMGSNAAEHPRLQTSSHLTWFHGHNHRSADVDIPTQAGNTINVKSYQPLMA